MLEFRRQLDVAAQVETAEHRQDSVGYHYVGRVPLYHHQGIAPVERIVYLLEYLLEVRYHKHAQLLVVLDHYGGAARGVEHVDHATRNQRQIHLVGRRLLGRFRGYRQLARDFEPYGHSVLVGIGFHANLALLWLKQHLGVGESQAGAIQVVVVVAGEHTPDLGFRQAFALVVDLDSDRIAVELRRHLQHGSGGGVLDRGHKHVGQYYTHAGAVEHRLAYIVVEAV